MGYNRTKILERDDYTCQKCGFKSEEGEGLHVHHKVPRSKGGSDDSHNLNTVCVDCHSDVHHGSKRSPRWNQSASDNLREAGEWAEWAVNNPADAIEEIRDSSNEPLHIESVKDASKVWWKNKIREVRNNE
jgi:hypothetical protein